MRRPNHYLPLEQTNTIVERRQAASAAEQHHRDRRSLSEFGWTLSLAKPKPTPLTQGSMVAGPLTFDIPTPPPPPIVPASVEPQEVETPEQAAARKAARRLVIAAADAKRDAAFAAIDLELGGEKTPARKAARALVVAVYEAAISTKASGLEGVYAAPVEVPATTMTATHVEPPEVPSAPAVLPSRRWAHPGYPRMALR